VKKLIISLILISGSVSFAEAPSALQVARDILKESGFASATQVKFEMQVTADKDGSDTRVVLFRMPKGNYSCDYTFFKPVEIKQEKYLIQAKMDNCTDASGEAINLENDYTDKSGHTFFQRVFSYENSQWKFDFMTDEEKVLARKSSEHGSQVFSADGVHISNDKIILIHGQEGAVLFN